jgi:ribose transport system substrate-binding protein
MSTNALSFTYNAAMSKGFQEAANAAGIKTVILDSKGDIQKHGNDVDDLIAQKVDGIVLMPQDAAVAQAWVDHAAAAGIPTLALAQQVGDPAKRPIRKVYEKLVGLVVPDEVDAGRRAGEVAAAMLPKDKMAKIAVIEGQAGFAEVVQRRQGFEIGLNKSGAKFQIAAAQPGDWREEKAEAACQNILAAHPDVDLFYTQSDEMVLGCGRAVRAAGSSARLVSMGGTKLAIDAIKAGQVDATVCYKPQDAGRLALNAVVSAIKANTPTKAEFITYETPAVTKANLSDCVPQW